MLVKNWMSTGVMSIRASDSVQHALKLQKEGNVKILPVIDDGKLVGIVTDRDLKKASLPESIPLDISEAMYITSKIKIHQVMTPYVFTISPDSTIDEAASIIVNNDISGLPVVDEERRIVGIITRSDILKTYMSITGVDKPGYQIAFLVKYIPGLIGEIIELVSNYGGRIGYVLHSDARAPIGFRNAYMRIYDINSEQLPKLLKKMKEKCTLRYVIDPFLDKKEIYEEL
ncbi:MAG: CBS domain-containing protein [Spirochaetota bacterium]|nr:CBS domain-containing protein [Spirochaetota bacterium]